MSGLAQIMKNMGFKFKVTKTKTKIRLVAQIWDKNFHESSQNNIEEPR